MTVPDRVATHQPEVAVPVADDPARPPIVDWGRTGRRLRFLLAGLGLVVVVAWVVIGVVNGGPTLRLLGELAGLGLLGAFVVEVVVVGGSAVRGMLAAGDRGDRLAGHDVSLLPPQLGRRRLGSRTDGRRPSDGKGEGAGPRR